MSRGSAARPSRGRPRCVSCGGRDAAARYPRAMAPYGSWPTPITSELVVRAAAGLGGRRRRRRHGDVVGAAARGGRAHPARAAGRATARRSTCCPQGSTPAPPCTSTAAAPGGSPGRTVWFANWADQRLYRLTGQGDAASRSRPSPRSPRATGGPTAALDPAAGGCWSCASTTRPAAGPADVVNEIVVLDTTRRAGPAGARVRARLRVRPPLLARRRPAVLAAVVAPRHAVGRHRAVRRRPAGHRRSAPRWPTRRSWPAGPTPLPAATATASRWRSPGGPRTGRCGSSPTGPAGGTCTAGCPRAPTACPRAARSSRWCGWTPRSACRSGCSASPATPSCPAGGRVFAYIRDGLDHLAVRAARRHRHRPRPAVHVGRLGAGRGRPGGVRRRVGRPPSPPSWR